MLSSFSKFFPSYEESDEKETFIISLNRFNYKININPKLIPPFHHHRRKKQKKRLGNIFSEHN